MSRRDDEKVAGVRKARQRLEPPVQSHKIALRPEGARECYVVSVVHVSPAPAGADGLWNHWPRHPPL